uniref:Integrase zinc-binding domain-containing protein n=1 Tax=Nicotiana tabacum TaxID=4097 RepID=A0A1S4AIE0_TOBAC|nr:PREDICTED: uncharacterized protein LOC107797973 [Nicotiana tabacum]
MAVDMNIKELLVTGDFDLLLHQVQGEWSTKNVKILPYLHFVKELCKKFTKTEFKHVPKIQNERFLTTKEYPKNAINSQKRALKILANHFFLNREVLYRRTPDMGLLRCVDAAKATRLLEEIHAGTCGPHMNGFTLAKKILRAGYLWMTMESDSIRYLRKCHHCQIHGISSGFCQMSWM